MNERINKLKQFLASNPADCFLNHALALEYVKDGNEAEAEKHFLQNIANDSHYVATYYHYGKLLERTGRQQDAINTYEKGMQEAKAAGDMHSYNELQAAYEDLVY